MPPVAEVPRRVLPADPDVHDHVTKLFGYMLTESVTDHSVVLLYGKGANSKTTL